MYQIAMLSLHKNATLYYFYVTRADKITCLLPAWLSILEVSMQNYSNLCNKPLVFVIHQIFQNPCRNHRKVVTFFNIAAQIMRMHTSAYLGYLI